MIEHSSHGRLSRARRQLIKLAWRCVSAPDRITQPQGYELTIEPERITLAAHDEAGVFYGVCTLIQLLETMSDTVLPGLHIVDWPDFPVRGVMLDISRDKVPHWTPPKR